MRRSLTVFALAGLAADNSASEDARKDALDALGAWANPNAKDRVLNLWRPLPPRDDRDAVAAVKQTLPALLKDAPAGVEEMAAKLAGKRGGVPAASYLLLSVLVGQLAAALGGTLARAPG